MNGDGNVIRIAFETTFKVHGAEIFPQGDENRASFSRIVQSKDEKTQTRVQRTFELTEAVLTTNKIFLFEGHKNEGWISDIQAITKYSCREYSFICRFVQCFNGTKFRDEKWFIEMIKTVYEQYAEVEIVQRAEAEKYFSKHKKELEKLSLSSSFNCDYRLFVALIIVLLATLAIIFKNSIF